MQALWTVALPEDASPWFVVGGQAVLVAAGRKVFAIDLENGAASPRRVRALERPRPSWRAEGDDAGEWVARDERGRASCDGDRLRVLDAKGREAWSRRGVSSIYGLTKISVACEEKARLVLRDRKTGEEVASLGPRPRRLHLISPDALRRAGRAGLELPGPGFEGPAWPGEKAALRRRKVTPQTSYFAADEWSLLRPRLAHAKLGHRLARSKTWEGRPSFEVTVPGRSVERFRALVKEIEPLVRARRLAKRPKNPVFVVEFTALERGEREARIEGACLVGAATRAEARKIALAWLNADTLRSIGEDGLRCRWSATRALGDYEEERELVLEPHCFPRAARVKVIDVGT